MNVLLWIAQSLLTVVFFGSGLAKLVMSKPRMIATGQTGVAPFPLPVIRLTATCEILASFGLILPMVTGIAPVLTPIAAVGLMIVMLGAAASHTSLHEFPQVVLNAFLFSTALFVAINRF